MSVFVFLEYTQQRHLIFPHFLMPGSVPRLAPRLLSTAGSLALTRMSLRLVGLKCATIGALAIHSFTVGFLCTKRLQCWCKMLVASGNLLSKGSAKMIGLSSSDLTTFSITSSLDLISTDWNWKSTSCSLLELIIDLQISMLFGMEHQHFLLSFGSSAASSPARRRWTGRSCCITFSLYRQWRGADCDKCGRDGRCLEEGVGRRCLASGRGRSG